MKTKNNVRKTMLRFAAVVLSFVLVSYTVSAQGFWKRFLENSSFGHLASVLVETEATVPDAYSWDTEALSQYFEPAVDARLELEPWMMDESCFAVTAPVLPEVGSRDLLLEPESEAISGL